MLFVGIRRYIREEGRNWVCWRCWWPVLWALVVLGAGLSQPLPPHPSSVTGFPALTYTGLALAIWGYLLLVGTALGRWALRFFSLPWRSSVEALLWALPTGLTLLGYPVYALGLLGLFHRTLLAALLLLLTLGWHREIHEVAWETGRWVRGLGRRWHEAPWGTKLGWSLVALMLGGSFLSTLTPPWMYDALWYHLQAPRLFLEAGRIYPEWNNWPANYAFAVNMLYALPMALGSDVVPRMLHWTFGVAFLMLLYQMARQEAGPWAWLAPAFVLTMPSFLITLAPSALIDVATAMLELMAYSGLLRALQEREMRWFWASALWAGLAVSTKQAALPVLTTVGVVWLWMGFPEGLSRRLRLLAGYGLLALALMTPWYLKNWLWFGTPVFPLGVVGDPETTLRLQLFSDYTLTNQVAGWRRLVFPLWLLFQPQALGYIAPPLALPILLFLFVPSFPRKGEEIPVMVGLRTLAWLLGPPRPRFLLAIWGLGGVALAQIVYQGWFWPRVFPRLLVRVGGLVTALLLLLGTLLHFLIFWSLRPWKVALGRESQVHFLERQLDGYQAWQYIKSHFGEKDRVLLIGDARHYYCPPQCYPEADQFTWTRWAYLGGFEVDTVLGRLRAEGITYLWLHHNSIRWLLEHDPGGLFQQSYAFLQDRILPRCGRVVYRDRDVTLIQLPCLRDRNEYAP